MVNDDPQYAVFDDRLAAIRELYRPDPNAMLADDRTIAHTSRYRVVYGPFSYSTNVHARIAIVGLTPGLRQLTDATEAAKAAIDENIVDPDEVAQRVTGHAAFAGTMRRNLVTMLDEIGVASELGLSTTNDLFGSAIGLLVSTSALRYPVFLRNGDNFHGTKDLSKEAAFRWMIDRLLGPKLEAALHALVVPLGDSAATAITRLVDRGILSRDRCLVGFPHPSGGNGHRVSRFNEHRARLTDQVASWFSGTGVPTPVLDT